ncbi:MAG: polyprenol monophosphomannose synthase [Vicinamibacterales bacterium]
MKILTLIVTYNEAENVAALIPEVLRHVPGSSVLVVDDASPDGTADVVGAIGASDSRVSVICRRGERGYGSAMIAGMRHAVRDGFDVVLTLDADFSHNPADLPLLLEALHSADVAVGSRYVGGVRVLNWDVKRLLLSLGANAYVRYLSGLHCVDCTSGFRGYRTTVLSRVDLASIRTTGYAFLPELLFTLGPIALQEVPICYTERRVGESKMSGRVIAEAVMRPWMLLLRRIGRRLRPTAPGVVNPRQIAER